jgi:hypothetical protein
MRGKARGRRGWLWVARIPVVGLAAVTAVAAGCSTDLFDLSVSLQHQTYAVDFGPSPGTIPDLQCDPASPGVCGGAPSVSGTAAPSGVPTMVTVSLGCDASNDRCFAQADATAAFTVDVLQDSSFTTGVERRGVTLVREADFKYTVTTNTLTFDVPQVDFFVGPGGTSAPTDSGVQHVDASAPIPAGQTNVTGTITVHDGTPAQALLQDAVRNGNPFQVIVSLSPRVEAGQPVPGGALAVDVAPTLRLGLPR